MSIAHHTAVCPLKLFWKMCHKLQDQRDGWHGFVFSILFAFSHFLLWAKYWECMQGASSASTAKELAHAAAA